MVDDVRLDRVKQMFEEFVTKGTGNLLFQHLAEDVLWRATAPAGTPLHEKFHGPQGVAEYFRLSQELFSMESAAVSAHLQSGDKIVVLGSERLCLRRTGQAQDLEWAMVISFREERIAEVLVIEDLSILLGP
jgi:uncharacterized protein